MTISAIKTAFEKEFAPLLPKFTFFELTVTKAKIENSEYVWKPGVYIWFAQDEVIKVGRSFTNARKRALEHIDYGKGGTLNREWSIQALSNSVDTKILLFNLKDEKDKHWAAALEIFFESILKPKIASGRLG